MGTQKESEKGVKGWIKAVIQIIGIIEVKCNK
jgi:hypothetical protein